MAANYEISDVWSFQEVSGVRCIVLDHAAHNENSAKKGKLKQELGEKYQEVPILDSKAVKNRREICDIIVVTFKLNEWIEEISALYSNRKLAERSKPIPGGYQKSFYKKQSAYINISVYEHKHKFMVQGNTENILHEFLKDFSSLKCYFAEVAEELEPKDSQ